MRRCILSLLGIVAAWAALLVPSTMAAVTPTTQLSSKAVEKDGLSVQVSLRKSEITTDEQPQFTVRFTNISEEYINLYGVDEYWDWKVRFTNLDQKVEEPGPWLLNVQHEFARPLVSSKRLKPGDFVDVPVDLNHFNTGVPTAFAYDGIIKHLVAPINHLKPGTYKMTIEIELKTDPNQDKSMKYWTGPVTTEAVELKVIESGERGPVTQASPQGLAIDPNVIAVGAWSDEVAGLRGRLLIAKGRDFADGKLHETVAYLELRNSPDAAGDSISVYFSPDIPCEMLDPQGTVVPQHGRGYSGGGGGRPNAEWVTLPYDSTIRLRLSPYGYGSEDGLRIDISHYEWNIKPTDKGEYTLSATYTSDPEQQPRNAWHGTLKLPGMKVANKSNAPNEQ